MTISLMDFLALANKPEAHLRKGQHLFNLLHEHKPQLANQIRGTGLDPFYRDNRLDDVVAWIACNWNANE